MTQSAPAAFFSYCREDSDFALRLAGDLKAAGASVWLDQMDIIPGQRWDRAVEDALTNCPRMLVILSPTSVNSTNVMDEVSFALEEKKTVIPVVYKDCLIPFRLRRVQYVDFRKDYAGGLKELLKTLHPEQSTPAISDAPRQYQTDAMGADKGGRAAEEERRKAEGAQGRAADQARVNQEREQAAKQERLAEEERKRAGARLEEQKPSEERGRQAGIEPPTVVLAKTEISPKVTVDAAAADSSLSSLVKNRPLPLLALTAIAIASLIGVIFLRSPNRPKEDTSTSHSVTFSSSTPTSQSQTNPARVETSTRSNSTDASSQSPAKASSASPTQTNPARVGTSTSSNSSPTKTKSLATDSVLRPGDARETKPDRETKGLLASGERYYKAGQYEHALPLLRKAAESGEGEAAAYLGLIYEKGLGGLPRDDAEAVKWYRKATEAGDARGMSGLGFMYESGRGGLPKDDAEAVKWSRKAAEAGDARGMNNLGASYMNGRDGLPRDDAEAVKWYRKAADAGNATGMANLGFLYESGRGGLPQDDVQALSCFRKAADAGDALAMANLGAMYASGRGGLPKDDAEAVKWYRKAVDGGDALGMANLGAMYASGRGGYQRMTQRR